MVHRFVEEVQNGHRLADLARYCRAAYVDHATPGGLPPAAGATGVTGFRLFFAAMLKAFPDLTMVIEDTVAAGDLVVTRKTARRTHQVPARPSESLGFSRRQGRAVLLERTGYR